MPVRRVEVLEPLRGLAALAVAWFHFTNQSALVPEGWLRSSGRFGWLGVEAFFVISGFIIPYALHQSGFSAPQDIGRFLLKRIVRLDPPYLFAIALTIALWYVSAAAPDFRGTDPHLEWVPLLLHLGYLNAFFGYPWIIPVLWTLAIEFQFYIVMSAVYPALAQRSWMLRSSALASFLFLPFLFPAEALVFRYLALFAIGVLTFQWFVGLISGRTLMWLLPLAAIATWQSLGVLEAVAGLLTAMVIAFIRIPKFAPLSFLGAVSYSLYLLHVPIGGRVVNLGSRFAHDTITRMLVLAAALLTSLAASYLMFRFVERPARTLSSSIRYRRRSEVADESADWAPAPADS